MMRSESLSSFSVRGNLLFCGSGRFYPTKASPFSYNVNEVLHNIKIIIGVFVLTVLTSSEVLFCICLIWPSQEARS